MVRLYHFLVSGESWKSVVRDTMIPWDADNVPLYVKTNSTAGSKDTLRFDTLKSNGNLSSVWIAFNKDNTVFHIGGCPVTQGLYWNKFPVIPTVTPDKIWKFSKYFTVFTISCNGVELVAFNFSESTNSGCVSRWEVGLVKYIMFIGEKSGEKDHRYDTASDEYLITEHGNDMIGEMLLDPLN